MPRQIRTPVSVLLAGVIIIVLALAGADIQPPTASGSTLAYPSYPSNSTSTTIPTTAVPTSVPAVQVAATATPTTSTLTSLPTVSTTPTATQFVPPTIVPATLTPTLIPTASMTPLPDTEKTCVPGQPVIIDGEGPPNAGILLYFNARAVGGGSVDVGGRFALTLIVGNELPGRYPVRVQVRGTQQVLRALDCVVSARPMPTITTTIP